MRSLALALSLTLASASAVADENDRRFGDKLVTAGAVTFTAAYAPMTLAGTTMMAMLPSDASFPAACFVPVGGPVYVGAGLGQFAHDDAGRAFAMLSILDGAAQIVGIGLMIGGGVHRHRARALVSQP